MRRNLHLTLEDGQWRGPGPSLPGGRLRLQVAKVGEPVDGWVPVLCGWVYGPQDPGPQPAVGVWVAEDVLDQKATG